MTMGFNKEIERIKGNISNLSEDELFEILKECGFERILPTEKIFEQLDVRKIVHAKWIEGRVDGRVCINCSNCGSIIPTDTQVDYLNLEDNKYCYWCGAIMGK